VLATRRQWMADGIGEPWLESFGSIDSQTTVEVSPGRRW